MSTKALKRELLAAIAMVLVAAVALSGSTFAWFAMNNTVTATGMNVTTKTSDNLFIAEDTLASTAIKAENLFKTAYVGTVSGLLEPVSTVNGTSFFYNATTNADTEGHALAATYTAYDPENTGAFNTNYDTTGAVGYVDYVFQLKAINGSAVDKHINVTDLTLTYGNTADAQKAFRVAVFVEDLGVTGSAVAPTGAVGTLKSIVKKSDAAYFSVTEGTSNTAPDAVSGTTALADVTNLGTALDLGTVTAGTTHYYKVVVRLWLEGEDTTCNNTTFASLTDAWALRLTAQLENATGGVSALSQALTTAKADLSAPATAASDAETNVTVDGQTYYVITDKTLNNDGATKLYATATGAVAYNSKIYIIDANGKPIEVTNQVILPAQP